VPELPLLQGGWRRRLVTLDGLRLVATVLATAVLVWVMYNIGIPAWADGPVALGLFMVAPFVLIGLLWISHLQHMAHQEKDYACRLCGYRWRQ